MVHPLMRETPDPTTAAALAHPIIALFPHLHVLVIGPGLGRDPLMQDTVVEIIRAARRANLSLVLDADALFTIQNNPDLIRGYEECVLTPNVVEFGRLAKALGVDADGEPNDEDAEKGCQALAQALGGVVIVRKGRQDWISNGEHTIVSDLQGGRKRSGGQGDTLTGCIGTLLAWRKLYLEHAWDTHGKFSKSETLTLAAWGGSAITRECSRRAFAKMGRSLQASDLTGEVGGAFLHLIGEVGEDE